jgi:hypothetical protein
VTSPGCATGTEVVEGAAGNNVTHCNCPTTEGADMYIGGGVVALIIIILLLILIF